MQVLKFQFLALGAVACAAHGIAFLAIVVAIRYSWMVNYHFSRQDMMLYVERLQNEKKNATGAEKGKLDLKVVEINIPDEDVKVAGFQRALQNIQVISLTEKVPSRTVYFHFRSFYEVRIQKYLRVWIWKLERNKNNKQPNPAHFHQCSMMDTDHHNSRLSSDQYDKSEQYCCPPMPLKLPYFEISGKPFGNKWDALTSILNHFIRYYVI